MLKLKLSVLIDALYDVCVKNFFEQEIESVTVDSRSCSRGSVFVAIKGAMADGNEFIIGAHEGGCRVFVTSDSSLNIHDSVVIISKTPRKTLAEICSAFYDNPEKKLICVGVTGTKGKTTTSVILSKIFDGVGIKNVVIGTLGVSVDRCIKTQNTTPDPTVLFPTLRDAVRGGAEVAVIEVSSQALKDFRVFGIPFKYVAFTGIGRDHVGDIEHPTVTDYIHSKRMLFEYYGAKCAVVNFDDPYASYMSFDVPDVIKCGFCESDGLVIRNFKDTPRGSDFILDGVQVKTSLPGSYNARNVTMAIALAREVCGISVYEASRYVKDVKVCGRFERKIISGKNVIVDYAHNADSLKEVACLCRRLFLGKVICVFGSVGGRSYARRAELAVAAEEYADFSVITSDNPGYEFPLSICADIYQAFKDKTKAKIIVDRKDAIAYALNEAETGDTLLLLGRGHETSMSICGKSIPFSDSSVVEQIMLEKGID